jgi:hypothetical protein
MERPTCNTCPYWDRDDIMDTDDIDSEEAEIPGDQCLCHRYPPRNHPEHIIPLDRQAQDRNRGATMHISNGDYPPLTRRDYWCGEHPDFPAYIESLRDKAAAGSDVVHGYREEQMLEAARDAGKNPRTMTLDEWMQIKGCGISTANNLTAYFRTQAPRSGPASPSPGPGC